MSAIDRLKRELLDRGMTPGRFCKQLGISSQRWHNWQTRDIPEKMIFKIAKHLQVTPEWLREGVGTKRAPTLELINSEPDPYQPTLDPQAVAWAMAFIEKHVSPEMKSVRDDQWLAKIFMLLYDAYLLDKGVSGLDTAVILKLIQQGS